MNGNRVNGADPKVGSAFVLDSFTSLQIPCSVPKMFTLMPYRAYLQYSLI